VDEPIAKQVAHSWQRPGGAVDDPWAWLSDRDDPATIDYLQAENAYSDEWFDGHQALIDQVFAEIKSRVQETDASPPVRRDPWWYVTRTEEGKSYPIHCRGTSAETATEQVVLDENVEAHGHDYFQLSAFDPSHDHSLLAWSCDTDGSEHYTMRIRDLTRGTDLDDVLTNTTWAGTAWSADGRWLLYVTDDEQQRPYRVWRHLLGTAQADDVLVYEESDERFFVGVDSTRSEEWIVIESQSKTSSEVWLLPSADIEQPAQLVRRRAEDVEYSADHWNDQFVILTNLDAVDFQVMTAPLDDPSTWTALVPGQNGRRIVGIEPFATHLVIHEWAEAQPRLHLLFTDGSERTIDLGDEPHDVELDANPMYTSTTLRYSYQSLTTPATIYDEDVHTAERVIIKQVPVLGVDLGVYTSERVWADADDGTQVPVDVVRRADATGPLPCCVYGYGSYEASMAPWFSVARLSLLDRGFAWALVHPRGGGELGRRWYLDGKLTNKRNTFTDTIAASRALIDHGIAQAGHLGLRGGSAGGLLVGACITIAPELYASAVAEVPFVDVVTTMSDPSLPLTVTEWEEWGDPRLEPFASYIASYSPYDNTRDGVVLPALFVTAGLNDPRVSYHEPAKWVAKMRALRHLTAPADRRPLLLRCEMGAGHGGPSGRYEAWREEARTLTFLLVTL